jgi:hypothetical protein
MSLPLLGMQLSEWLRKSILPLLHEHGRALHAAPAFRRPVMRVPAG